MEGLQDNGDIHRDGQNVGREKQSRSGPINEARRGDWA